MLPIDFTKEFASLRHLPREMARLQSELNRLFGESETFGYRGRFPAVNVWTNEDSVFVTAELAGFDVENIHISVVEGVLNLKGCRKSEELKEGETFHRQEREYGKFSRSIRLPFQVDPEKVEAQYKNGILNITMPRAERDKPKKIKINVAD